ncbi:MAG: putative DNA binding domain-containing protein [Lachnospiraceae bacterium]|nr:putative DNA binding domain-containing protein [Lachnospiraceae bacterium]
MLESKTTEFKREYIDDIKYTVIAFANTDGGKVYVGIGDDGSVCGIEDTDDVMLRITNMIRDAIRPDVTMFTECSVEDIDGKRVVALTVLRGTARPYYLYGKGVRPEGVYIRQGASSVPASETAILDMIKETSGDCYEDARSLNQQLTFDKTAEYFAKKNVEFGDAQKRTLNIISEDGTYSNLGMMLSDQCTHMIKMAVFEGSKKTVFKDRRELNGSLLEQLEQAYAYINQFNRTRSEFEGLERIDKRDYPPEALREALLNAIVHRDYSMSGPGLISIFDDRIEFVTIGGLVRGISYDDIMLGVSALRNEHLANVFYRLRLIEAYGTGMMKINECYAGYAVKPRIDISEHAFKITLPNMNYVAADNYAYTNDNRRNYNDSKLNASYLRDMPAHYYVQKSSAPYITNKEDRESIVISLFENQDTIVRKDIEIALNVSQATAVLVLRDLVAKGILIKEGGGKYLRYRLAN